jgi:tetratricopeptide (TPR) repeat protein
VALNSLGRFEEALPFLKKAIELDSYNVEYLTGIAAILRDAGRNAEALRFAAEALKLQPENPQLQNLVRSLGG